MRGFWGGRLRARWPGVLPAMALLLNGWVKPAQCQEAAGVGGTAPPVSPVGSAPPVATATRPVDVQLVYTATPDYRRAQLEEERASYGLGGPIALTTIGAVMFVGGGVSFTIGTLIKSDCVFDTTCQHKPWLYAGVPLMVMGAVMTGLGGAWIGVRVAHRNRLDREIERLGPAVPAPTLSVGLVPRAFGSAVQLRMSF